MKGIVLEPAIADESVIVQFTDNVDIDKHTEVKVPNGFIAVVFIDERVAFKADVTAGKRLAEFDKGYVNKQCKVAFIRTKLLPAMMWGFGNIHVNNARLKETYRVGANGKYTIEIADISTLMRTFYTETNITCDMLRDKTISVIKTVGASLMSKFFADADVSVFEVNAQAGALRNKLLNGLAQDPAFGALGIRLKDLTVDGIHVNEDDLELIRNRITD